MRKPCRPSTKGVLRLGENSVGGDPHSGETIKHIPCWCFHGACDDITDVGDKVVSYYEATAKWEQLDGVWVPVHHRHVKGDGTVVREYKISWDWINKDIDDKEFTIDALNVPNDVQKIYFDERGQDISKSVPLSFEEKRAVRRRTIPWIRWGGYSLGFLLIAIALLRYRLRKKPSNPA